MRLKGELFVEAAPQHERLDSTPDLKKAGIQITPAHRFHLSLHDVEDLLWRKSAQSGLNRRRPNSPITRECATFRTLVLTCTARVRYGWTAYDPAYALEQTAFRRKRHAHVTIFPSAPDTLNNRMFHFNTPLIDKNLARTVRGDIDLDQANRANCRLQQSVRRIAGFNPRQHSR